MSIFLGSDGKWWDGHFNNFIDYSYAELVDGSLPELDEIAHVTHLEEASEILINGNILAKEINEIDRKCNLEEYNEKVVWASPRDWEEIPNRRGDGRSIYGHIKFVFKWEDLMDVRKIEKREKEKKEEKKEEANYLYWAGGWSYDKTGEKYGCRFVLSKKCPEQMKEVYQKLYDYLNVKYNKDDFVRPTGPILLANNRWTWRNNLNVQFLIEGDLPLDKCSHISFTEHDKKNCNLIRAGNQSCPDEGLSKSEVYRKLVEKIQDCDDEKGLAAIARLSKLVERGKELQKSAASHQKDCESLPANARVKSQ